MSSYQGDPLIKWNGGDGGDIIKNAGDYTRNPGIENMINILLGTNPGLWSNVYKKNRIPGFAVGHGEVITLDYLRNTERDAEAALQPMKTLNIAETITVTATNPINDTIVLEIVIAEKAGPTSTYTRTWSREFD